MTAQRTKFSSYKENKVKWFYDLKIPVKLQGSFVLVAAIAGLIGWIGLFKVNLTKTNGATLYAARLVPIQFR